MDKLQVVKATAKSHQNIDQKMLDSTWRPPLNGMGVGQWFLGKAQKKDWWFDLICGLVAVTVSEVQFIPITRPRFPLPSSFYMKSRPSNALDADKSSLCFRCRKDALSLQLLHSSMDHPWLSHDQISSHPMCTSTCPQHQHRGAKKLSPVVERHHRIVIVQTIA